MTDSSPRSDTDRILARATQLERAGEWRQANKAYSELFRAAVANRDPVPIATASRRQAQVMLQSGNHEAAEELAELSCEVAVRCGLMEDVARAYNVIGMVYFYQNDYAAAIDAYTAAIETARMAGEDRTIIHASRNLGAIMETRGDLVGARALYLEGVAATLRQDDPRAAASIYAHLGNTAQTNTEWMEAELHYRRAIELAEHAGDTSVAGTAMVALAGPLIEMKELASAAALLDSSEEVAITNQNYRALADASRMRGRIAIAIQDLGAAEKYMIRALGIATTHNLSREKAEVLEDIGNLRQLQNRPILAKSAWREALEIFQELGAEANVARLTQLIQA